MKLDEAIVFKELGNKHFNDKELVEAESAYIEAFKIIEEIEKENNGNYNQECLSLQAVIASNLAESALQCGRPYDAVIAAKIALQKDCHNPKSWFRLARAYGDLRYFASAVECCKEVAFLQRSKGTSDALAFQNYCESRVYFNSTSPTSALTNMMNVAHKLKSEIQREALMVALDNLNSNSLERPSVEFAAAIASNSPSGANIANEISPSDQPELFPHCIIRAFAKTLVVGVCVPDLFNPELKGVINERPWGLLGVAKGLFLEGDLIVFVDAIESLREAIDDPDSVDGMPLWEDSPEALVRRVNGESSRKFGLKVVDWDKILSGRHQVCLWEDNSERANDQLVPFTGHWENWLKTKTRVLCFTEGLLKYMTLLQSKAEQSPSKKLENDDWLKLLRLLDAGMIDTVFRLLVDCGLQEEKTRIASPTSAVAYICFVQLMSALGVIAAEEQRQLPPQKITEFANLYFDGGAAMRAGRWQDIHGLKQFLSAELKLFSKLGSAVASHSKLNDAQDIIKKGIAFEYKMFAIMVFFLHNSTIKNESRKWLGKLCSCKCDYCKHILSHQKTLASTVNWSLPSPISDHPQSHSCSVGHHTLDDLDAKEGSLLAVVSGAQAFLAEKCILRGLSGSVLVSCEVLWGGVGQEGLEAMVATFLEGVWVCQSDALFLGEE